MTPLTPEQKQMVEDNIGLAGMIAKRYTTRTPLDYEELFSICSEALCRATLVYNPDKGYKFSTIACMTMKGRIFNRLRDDKHLNDCYLSDLDYHSPETFMPPVEEIVDMQNAVSNVLKRFGGNQREKAAAITFIHNPHLQQIEIAKLAGVSQRTVSTAITRLRKQLHKQLAY